MAVGTERMIPHGFGLRSASVVLTNARIGVVEEERSPFLGRGVMDITRRLPRLRLEQACGAPVVGRNGGWRLGRQRCAREDDPLEVDAPSASEQVCAVP